MIKEARDLATQQTSHTLEELSGFLEHQREHPDYASARERGLPIGSGAVEGGSDM